MTRTMVAMLVGAMGLSLAQPSFAAEVDRRQRHQEQRIKEGERKGKLTPAEEGQLEGEHKAIRKQINSERAANGGHLTRGERRQVNKEQNAESKQIYEDKH
jgi:hypothetical protein